MALEGKGREALRHFVVNLVAMLPEDKRSTQQAAEVVADALADMIEKDAQEVFLASLAKVLEEEASA